MGRTCVGRQIGMLGAPIGAIGGVANWWDPNNEGLCVYQAQQPKGAASFAASLIDLTGNGNDVGDPGGAATPGWNTPNGWLHDGIQQYLTTTFVPANDQSQCVLVQFTGVVGAGNRIVGARTAVGSEFGITPDQGGTDVRYYNGGLVTQAPRLLAGNLGISGNQGYRNGIADGGAIGAWGGVSTRQMYIGCRWRGATDLFQQVNIQALVIYDCTLTAPQVLAIATAMAAL